MNRRLHHALVSAGCVGLVVGSFLSPAGRWVAADEVRPQDATLSTCGALGCLPSEPPPTVAPVPPVVATGIPPVPSSRFGSGPAPQAPSGGDPNGTTGGRP